MPKITQQEHQGELYKALPEIFVDKERVVVGQGDVGISRENPYMGFVD